jgi:hypothetical protein
MNGNTDTVWIRSTPGGAKVTINGMTQTTPTSMEVQRAPFTVTATKDGFEPTSEHVGTHMSSLAVTDIVVGLFLFWPNLFGLLHPGARDHDKHTIQLNLQPIAGYQSPVQEYKPRSMDELQRAQYLLGQQVEVQQLREAEYQRWKHEQGSTN